MQDRVSGGPRSRQLPPGLSPGSLPPQVGHSLGKAGTDESHSNSTTRTKDFMGTVRSTPPCDGNVLGHQAGYLRAEKRGCQPRQSLLRAVDALQRLSPARRRSEGLGGAEREWPRPAPSWSSAQETGPQRSVPPRCACSLWLPSSVAGAGSECLDARATSGATRAGMWQSSAGRWKLGVWRCLEAM